MNERSIDIAWVEQAEMVINRNFIPMLSDLGLNSFNAFWHYSGGTVIKKIKAREIRRIAVVYKNTERVLYLKRHNREFLGIKRLLAPISPHRVLSQGQIEFRNICDFRKAGLPTVTPIAAGKRFHRFFWVESFFISESFLPFIPLESFLKDNAAFFKGSKGEHNKRIFIENVALMARKMHKNGFNHRDFNATHILINDQPANGIKLSLYDLQRVDRKKWGRFRWIIKALAELNYTLPPAVFNAQDRIGLLLNYKGREHLQGFDRFQWRWIIQKTGRIARHTENMIRKRNKRREKGQMER